MLKTAAATAQGAVDTYGNIPNSFNTHGVSFNDIEQISAQFNEAVIRIQQVFEMYSLQAPTKIDELIALVIDELKKYQSTLDQSQFSADQSNMEIVASIQRAIGRVVARGTHCT